MTEGIDKKAVASGSDRRLGVLGALRFWMRFLLPLFAVSITAIVIVFFVQERRGVLADYRYENQKITAQIVRRQAELVQDTRNYLTDLAQTTAVADPLDPACGLFLAQQLSVKPQFVDLAVTRANGDFLCMARPSPKVDNLADRAFQFDLTEQVVSVKFADPMLVNPDRSAAAGAMVAVVSLNWWSDALADVNLPKGTLALITDSRDQIIATYPKSPGMLGRTVMEIGFGAGKLTPSGSAVSTGADGLRRLFIHEVLFSSPGQGRVFMSLGIPINSGLSEVNQRAAIRLVSFSAVLAVLWLVARQLLGREGQPLYAMHRKKHRIRQPSEGPKDASKPALVGNLGQITQKFQRISQEYGLDGISKDRRVEHMEALLDALPDNYFRIDSQGIILDYRARPGVGPVNDPVAFLGRKLAEILPSEPRALFEENMQNLQVSGEVMTWEYHLNFEGKRRSREAHLCPISGSEEMVLVVRDISMRRQAQKERAVAEARLERIVTSLPGAVLSRKVTKAEGSVAIYVSSKSVEIWGYTPQEVYATKGILEATIDPDDLDDFENLMVRATENRETYSHRYQITTRFGDRKWLEAHTSCHPQEDGSLYTDAFVTDVTDEMLAQQQMKAQKEVADRAQKLDSIGQLTGGVAHDFNNLLAAIMGSLELLRDDERDAEKLSLIDAGITAATRGADLTRGMLAFARRANLAPSVIDLNTLVKETHNWAGRALPSNVGVETSLATGLWSIKADVSATESALLNLIVNARDAMPHGGVLTIETRNETIDQAFLDAENEDLEPGRYVILAVSDTGDGIPEHVLGHIFEPFFSTKAPGAGTGLGLPMVLGFMRMSGGMIRVISGQAAGTTFELYFKALTDPADSTGVASERIETTGGEGQRILVVEDEKNILTILIRILEKAGYDVTTAGTGDEAMEAFEADPTFDLLLTDIMIPGSLQGPALSRIIRERAPDLPVVFLSGYIDEAILQDDGLRPEDIRLTKPVMREDLLTAIKTSLKY